MATRPPEEDVLGPVLLVEDDCSHAELTKFCFRDHPTTLFHVENGEEALDYLYRRGPYQDAAQSPRPRLILLDLHLPRKSGFEVLQVIKTTAALRTIPVVILSTSDARQDIVRAFARCANDYIVKPLDFAAFTQAIRKVGRYWLRRDRVAV